MIKIMEGDPKRLKDAISSAKFLLTGNIDGELLQDGELIPFDVSGRFVPQTISINELGKQLLKASGEGNVNEIRTLMSKGAPFTADWLGTSPLHLAAQNNHLEVCEILLRAGISKDAITKVARTPLHMAAYEGHIEIVACLLKHGADYDCRDMLEMTPLHWAAQNGHADVVTILIRYGASTTPVNKFDLTPADLALQIKRHDIVEIINVAIRDPLIATQHLQLEMTSDSNDTMDISEIKDNEVSYVPIQAVSMEDIDSESSVDPERINMNQTESETQIEDLTEEVDEPQTEVSISDSIKYLQEHGITMLPADDGNILSTVMESGHSVVLTEVGKQVLNSIKQSDTVSVIPKANQKPLAPKENNLTLNMKKIITVTPEEFVAMTTNGTLSNNFIKQVNSKLVTVPKNNVKRIVMRKNKITPIAATMNISKMQKLPDICSDVETLKKQLIEAYKVIEEYKVKLRKKELEADQYKQRLKLLLEAP